MSDGAAATGANPSGGRDVDLRPDEEVHPGGVVLRFSPVSPDSVLEKARDNHLLYGGDDDPRFFSSVFVLRSPADAADEDLHRELLAAAQLSHIYPGNNRLYFVCQASAIYELGFTFKKDRYDGESENHYSVDLGPSPTSDDASRLVSAFDRRKVTDVWNA